MGELVLLVVAAAWLAVLIPPLLRSRIENRPNSSVTDFRRQLNRLQGAVPHRASASMRGVARPLAQSPLQRPAAGGRPGVHQAQLRRAPAGRSHSSVSTADHQRGPQGRGRSHGDPTGGRPRPPQHPHRQAHVARHNVSSAEQIRRRRANVLFMLVVAAGATLFLAATTKEPALLYLFALSFLALVGYTYLLSQVRQREAGSWPNDWMHH
ncbi:MAG TPA: hypothetical protein VIS05_09520 [Ilumatobacter sp.]